MNSPSQASRPRAFVSIAVLVWLLPLACFKPDPNDGGDELGGSESGTDGVETSTGDVETGDSTDTISDSSDSSDSTDSTDSTTGEPAACDDGKADAGELCLANQPSIVPLAGAGLRLDIGRFGPHPGVAIVGGPNAPAAVILVRGNGDLTFADPVVVPIDSVALSIDVGDLDDDGDDDLATHGPLISTRLNDGAGGWEFPQMFDPGGLGTEATRIQIGQFDGNAPLDLVWADGYNTDWVRGTAMAGWTPGAPGTAQFTGGDSWVEVTEWGFDGDGFTDLAVTSQWTGVVSIDRGMGDGTFMEHGQVEICESGSCTITELHVDDVDADGNPDLVASFTDGISVVLGKDDGTFEPFMLHAVPGADFTTSKDVDNDGDVDLLVASATTGSLYLLLGDGTGDFAEPIVFMTPATSLRTAAIVDLNEDGAPELVTTYVTPMGGALAVFEAQP